MRIIPQRGMDIFAIPYADAKSGELVKVRVEEVKDNRRRVRNIHYAWHDLPADKYEKIRWCGVLHAHYMEYRQVPISFTEQALLDAVASDMHVFTYTLEHQHDNPHALIVCEDVVVGVLP